MKDPLFDFDGNDITDDLEMLLALDSDPSNPLADLSGGIDRNLGGFDDEFDNEFNDGFDDDFGDDVGGGFDGDF